MTPSLTLTRPLADRVAALPDTPELADSPEAPPQAVIDAAIKALDEGRTHYTDRPGILPLRQWVAGQLQTRYNVTLSPDDVTITCGATEARFVCVTQLAKDGGLYVPGDPALIAGAAHLANATITASLDDPAAIRAAYLTPHDGKAALEMVLPLVREHGWWLIWDMRLGREDFHPAQTSDIAGRVVSVGSLDYRLPGWRIGWMAGSENAKQLRAFKQSMTICSPSISQWAALGMVDKS